jgi:hypothetical protein
MIDYVRHEEDLISRIVSAYKELKAYNPGHELITFVRLTDSGGVDFNDRMKFVRHFRNHDYRFNELWAKYSTELDDAIKEYKIRFNQASGFERKPR